jgi:hypothetical protein
MRIRYLPWLLLSGAAFFCSSANLRAETPTFRGVPNSRPAFQVSVAHPTKDKPQSKLWFAHGSWWAWLPTRDGSSVWRRTEKGWLRQSSLDRALFGLPGQADVWAGQDAVRAVLVGEKRLVVAGLKWTLLRTVTFRRRRPRYSSRRRIPRQRESSKRLPLLETAADAGGSLPLATANVRACFARLRRNAMERCSLR